MRFSTLIGMFLCATCCDAFEVNSNELPVLSIDLADGKTYRGILDARTSPNSLWLRFGVTPTVVRRGFDWRSVVVVRDGERELSPQDVILMVNNLPLPAANGPRKRILIAPAEAGSQKLLQQPLQRETGRIADVRFDAMLGNWDQDVAADGLLVQVTPTNADGDPVVASGTLVVELISTHRIAQDAAAHGRGSIVRSLGSWSVRLDDITSDSASRWIRLPFQAAHPEMDTDWAPFGLVHLQFIAVGEGVFHRSMDGLRIRPWAPFRDALERTTGERFLPNEVR